MLTTLPHPWGTCSASLGLGEEPPMWIRGSRLAE